MVDDALRLLVGGGPWGLGLARGSFDSRIVLKNTGAITLPSLDDIERAPADLKERLTECLQNTSSIELGHEDYPNLQGTQTPERQHTHLQPHPHLIPTPVYACIHIYIHLRCQNR